MAVTGTLEQIRAKVRKVTGMLSPNQLSNDDLDDYINDFYLYDFPAHVKTWNLTTALPPIWGPNENLAPGIPFYVFDWNAYTNISPPFYVGGYEIQYFQDQESFFNIFPTRTFRTRLATGDGTPGPYVGTISQTPILTQGIFVSTIDAAGNSLVTSANGAGQFDGTGVVAPTPAGGTVNYITGAVAGLTFTANIAVGEPIWSQTMTYTSGRPQAVLFIDGALFFYPVPDIAYEFSCKVYQVPDTLEAGDQPIIRDWWNLIAYGAALKIFADNMDMESYSKIDPLFNKQLRLVERRTLCQIKNQRVATIYNQSPNARTPFSSTL